MLEELEEPGRPRPEAVALGIAGADRPEDDAVLRAILRRLGFRDRVVVTNDARIAFVAGSPARVGLALVCGTGSIAWGQNARGEVARAGGWGWHLGDEGSGFWIGVRAVREALRASDGRGPATRLQESLIAHFEIARPEQILRAVYDGEFPRHRVADFAVRVEEAALAGDEAARSILAAASNELVLAAASVRERLALPGGPYDVVLSGGTFRAVPTLEKAVADRLAAPGARIVALRDEPAVGAVRLAVEALSRPSSASLRLPPARASAARAALASAPVRAMKIAARTFPRARASRRRALGAAAPEAAATVRTARSRSFAEPRERSTIQGPKTRPEAAKADVVIWFKASLVAVPAFNLVEPATTSGPTRSTTTMSARARVSGEAWAVIRTVRAPRCRARASAPRTNGVTELAETPITRSPGRAREASRAPCARASSAPSFDRKTAARPPAMKARTRLGSVPKVGGSSAASRTASRPLVPAPNSRQLPPER